MTVVLLRHAWAGDRDSWEGDDRLRPLDARGRRQAEALREALLVHGVRRAVSSPYVRCTETVAPLALDIVLDDRLAEGADADGARELLLSLSDAVACTHGDVIENVLGRKLKKGAAVVLDDLRVVAEIPAP
ncbi:MAG TPA: phosphoglycerate mutase family protein [Gaiellaceae bacterium]|nr:phosphoglycerate mutase family protein [Gaiellaceae bacterium]